jgi:hypothetical protein
MFEVTIQYSAKDLQRAYQLHYQKGYPIGSRLLMILGVISLIIGGALLAYSYLYLQFSNPFAWFLIAYGVLMIMIYFWRFYTIGKRMFKKMPEFQHPYHYTFSEKGIKAESPLANSDNQWEYYNRCIISDDMILLLPNKFRFNFFARRHFTDEQFKMLRHWVEANVMTR